MEFAIVFIIFLTCLFIYVGWMRYHAKDTLSHIPGPKGWPLFGNLFQLPKGDPHAQFTEWAKEFGPIFKLRLGSKNVVVVNDLDCIYEVLVTKGKDFAGRPQSFRRDCSFNGYLGVSGGDFNTLLQETRKVVHASLKTFGSGMDRIEQLALLVTDDMLQVFQNMNGKPIDPKDEIYIAATKMIALLVFGDSFQSGSESYDNVISALVELITGLSQSFPGLLLDTFPWVRYFGNSAYKHIKKGDEHRTKLWKREVIDKLHDWDLDSYTDDTRLPVAQSLFAYEKRRNAMLKFPDMHKQAACTQVMLAGVFTTMCTMLGLLNILIHHPEIQAKMHEEIDSVLGEKKVNLNDRGNLPFICATILETHRYITVVPSNLPHKTLRDTDIKGTRIPQNTTVMTNIWALHHDEEVWPEPFSFKPERFLDENGDLVAVDHPNRRHVIPFGAGPRVCLGENVAQTRIFLWTVTILQRFELKADESSPLVPCDPRLYVPEVVHKPDNYKLCFLPRTGQRKRISNCEF